MAERLGPLSSGMLKHRQFISAMFALKTIIEQHAFIQYQGQTLALAMIGGGYDFMYYVLQDLVANGEYEAAVANNIRGPWSPVALRYNDFFYSQDKSREWGLYIKLKRGARTRSPNKNRMCIRVPHQ